MVETLRDVIVLDSHHVLDSGQRGLRGLLDLQEINDSDIGIQICNDELLAPGSSRDQLDSTGNSC